MIASSKPLGFDTSRLSLDGIQDLKLQQIVVIPKKAPIRQCYAKLNMAGVHYLLWENGKTVIDTLVPDQEQHLTIFYAIRGMKKPDGTSRDEFYLNKEIMTGYPFTPSLMRPEKAELLLIAENYSFRKPLRFSLDVRSFETIRLTPYAKAP